MENYAIKTLEKEKEKMYKKLKKIETRIDDPKYNKNSTGNKNRKLVILNNICDLNEAIEILEDNIMYFEKRLKKTTT